MLRPRSVRISLGFGELDDFTPHILMNQQGVSEICFEETYAVAHDQTARSLFARLPHGREYAQTLVECLATGYLVAVVESICIREMQLHVDSAVEVVVGRTVHIEHRGPVPPATRLRLRDGSRASESAVRRSASRHMTTTNSYSTGPSRWWRRIGPASNRESPRRSMRLRRLAAAGSGSDGWGRWVIQRRSLAVNF